MEKTTARIDVFYVPVWRVWSVTQYDADDNRVGDSIYASKKGLAEIEAQVLRRNLRRSIPIRIYTADFKRCRIK